MPAAAPARLRIVPTPEKEKTAHKTPQNGHAKREEAAKAMLPPQNDIEVAEPGSSGETLHQRKLKDFYALQEAFYDIRDRYHAAYEQLQNAIIKGASIQTGAFKVDHAVRLVRRPRYKQVVIDLKGEAYQQRVLENTAPHAHFRVRIH